MTKPAPGTGSASNKAAAALSIEDRIGLYRTMTLIREFEEEVGLTAPEGRVVFLGELRQPGGKRVSVWAIEGDLDVTHSSSNTFAIEWPRGSGKIREFPEVARVEWVSVDQARRKLVKGQAPFLDALLEAIAPVADRGSTTQSPG